MEGDGKGTVEELKAFSLLPVLARPINEQVIERDARSEEYRTDVIHIYLSFSLFSLLNSSQGSIVLFIEKTGYRNRVPVPFYNWPLYSV